MTKREYHATVSDSPVGVVDPPPSNAEEAWPETRMTHADRCDRCPARAQVRWVRDGHWIDTCAHHAREHGEALLEWSHWLVDRRDPDDFAKD